MAKANPGGQIAPEDVVGRDKLIEQIWDRLEQQCVLINAERRIGKTSVLKKMFAEPREGWFPIFQDLERIQSQEEFAKEVFKITQTFLANWKKGRDAIRRILETTKTEKIDFGGRNWQELLEDAIKALVKEKSELRLVWFWDEVPYMIDNIRAKEGEQAAAQVLDMLRSLRQQFPNTRMVFTGSVGLHHVLNSIKSAHIATEPVNDMYQIEVKPLLPEDAKDLATRLIAGEELHCDNIDETADAIANEVDCFPFYIHHVICGLKIEGLEASADNAKSFVAQKLIAPEDPWEFGHYRSRIPIYYSGAGDKELVFLILDSVASRDAISLDQLIKEISSQTDQVEKTNVLRLMRLLERDHYLSRTDKNEYQFRFQLIKRWWRLDRGI